MAAAVTERLQAKLGGDTNLELVIGSIAFDNSYPTGGEAIAITGIERIEALDVIGGTGGYSFSWDVTNQKLLAYYNDYDAGADGAHIQVPNTTDLSALTAVQFVAWGQ